MGRPRPPSLPSEYTGRPAVVAAFRVIEWPLLQQARTQQAPTAALPGRSAQCHNDLLEQRRFRTTLKSAGIPDCCI